MPHAQRVDREKPDNLNIISAIASLYSDKLGGSAERRFYAEQLSADTLPWVRVSFPGERTEEILAGEGAWSAALRTHFGIERG